MSIRYSNPGTTQTLAGARTITLEEFERYDALPFDPGGADRVITLPAEASCGTAQDWAGLYIQNDADADEILIINNDGGTTIASPGQGEMALVMCDGTKWWALETSIHLADKVVLATDDLTLDRNDSGKTIIMGVADKVVTLPPTELGLEYTITAGVVSVTTGLSVDPDAADQLIGAGFTPADDKDTINTQATEAVGDSITVVGDGSAGWYITNVQGTWAREA